MRCLHLLAAVPGLRILSGYAESPRRYCPAPAGVMPIMLVCRPALALSGWHTSDGPRSVPCGPGLSLQCLMRLSVWLPPAWRISFWVPGRRVAQLAGGFPITCSAPVGLAMAGVAHLLLVPRSVCTQLAGVAFCLQWTLPRLNTAAGAAPPGVPDCFAFAVGDALRCGYPWFGQGLSSSHGLVNRFSAFPQWSGIPSPARR